MNRRDAYRLAQSDIGFFSENILGMRLYRYQREWAQPAFELILNPRPETSVIIMPRQSGKNETSSHIEVASIVRAGRSGGHIVKAAPTFKPQVVTSIQRFRDRIDDASKRLRWLRYKPIAGYIVKWRKASITFLSAASDSNVVSATASLALEVDEAQDVIPAKYDKDFAPMRAARGAPVLAYGTPWTDTTLLERFRQEVESGAVPGHVYIVTPERVSDENPAYGAFVDSEVRRLGRDHPLVRTQYFLELLKNRGRALTEQQLRQMIGTHDRASSRTSEIAIVAGLDFAGSDETEIDLSSVAALKPSGRDSVALTVGSVEWTTVGSLLRVPKVRVLARYEWTNQHPLDLLPTLLDLLQEKWQVNRVHADATGVGSTGVAALARAIDGGSDTRVHPVKFSGTWEAQTRIASEFISAANSSRFQDYKPSGFDPVDIAMREQPDPQDVHKHAWWQRGHARLEAKESKTFRLYVPDNEGHDDLLVADMLCMDAAVSLPPLQEISVTGRGRYAHDE